MYAKIYLALLLSTIPAFTWPWSVFYEEGQEYLRGKGIKDLGNATQFTVAQDCDVHYHDFIPLIVEEFRVARQMALYASALFAKSEGFDTPYGRAFMPDLESWHMEKSTYVAAYLKSMARAATPGGVDERGIRMGSLRVACSRIEANGHETYSDCNSPLSKYEVIAFTDPDENSITLCSSWFEERLPSSDQVKCKRNYDLPHFNSKARAIVHELAHLYPYYQGLVRATDVKGVTYFGNDDIAYGVEKACDLAQGDFKVPDPESKEIRSEPEKAAENADNWAWLAVGLYHNAKCRERAIAKGKWWPSIPVECSIAAFP